MGWLYVLIIGTVMMLLFSAIVFQFDFLSPTLCISAVSLLSEWFVYANADSWLVNFLPATAMLYLLSLMAIFGIEMFWKNKNVSRVFLNKEELNKPIVFQKDIFWLFTVFDFIVNAFYCKEISRVANLAGSFSTSIIVNYRQMTSYADVIQMDAYISTWVAQAQKIVAATAYIYMFIYLNNVLCENKENGFFKRLIGHIYLLIPAGITIFESFITGGRMPILQMLVFGVVVVYLLQLRKTSWKNRKPIKKIAPIIASGIVFLFAFYLSANLIRKYGTTKLFTQYIGIYVGAPLQLLNLYIENPVHDNLYFGDTTFAPFYNSLRKLGLISTYCNTQLEYRSSGGVSIGNVYTFIRRPLQDFGYVGYFIFLFIVMTIFCYVYYAFVRRQTDIYKSNKTILLYAYFFYIILFFPIDNEIIQLTQLGRLIFIFFLIIGFRLITRTKFKIKNRIMR